MSVILPAKSKIKLIGVQEMNHFRFTYKMQTYEVVLFPDYHADSNFSCEQDQECKEINKQIDEQIAFVRELDHISFSRTFSEEQKKGIWYKEHMDAIKEFEEKSNKIFKSVTTHNGCLLIPSWFIHLGTNTITCIDIFLETRRSDRDLKVTRNEPVLMTTGALFGFCGIKPKGNYGKEDPEKCASILPHARFHALDMRDRYLPMPVLNRVGFPERLREHNRNKASELTLHLMWMAIHHEHEKLIELELPKSALEALLAIDKQFHKSVFKHEPKLFFEAFKAALQLPKNIFPVEWALAFRVEARLFDAYTILRIFNTTWTAREEGLLCNRPPRHIVYFAGSAHTGLFYDFLKLIGVKMEPIFQVVNRNPTLSEHQFILKGDITPQPNCLEIPFKNLPFQHLTKTNFRNILQIATDEELVDYMQSVPKEIYTKLLTPKYDELWKTRLSTQPKGWEDKNYSLLSFGLENNIPLGLVWHTSRELFQFITDDVLKNTTNSQTVPEANSVKWKLQTYTTWQWTIRMFLATQTQDANKKLAALFLTINAIPHQWQELLPSNTDMTELLYVIINEHNPFPTTYFPLEPEEKATEEKYDTLFTTIRKGTELYKTVRKLFLIAKPNTNAAAIWCARILHEYERKMLTKK